MSRQHATKERGRRSAGEHARRRLLAGVPVTERRVQLAGVSTAMLAGGDGPPLVLLHGGIECGGVNWARVISPLAASHRLIVPDVPGLGESGPLARLDAVAFADWFAALIGLTCDEAPDLVAHSLLGGLAARFAAQRGDRLRRLVLYGATGIGRYRVLLGLRVVEIRFGLRPSERNAERFDRRAFFDLDRTRHRDPGWFEAFGAYTMHVIDDAGHVPHIEQGDAFPHALHAALGSR